MKVAFFLAFLAVAAVLVTTPALAQTALDEPAAATPPADPHETPDFPAPAPVPPLRPRRTARLTESLEAAYAYESLYGIWINAADATALLGADLGVWSIGAQAELAAGKTDGGLTTFAYSIGAFAEAHVDRLRFGGGTRLGGLSVQRVTTSGSIGSGSIGVFGRLSFDLVPLDDEWNGAVFLVAKASVDEVGGGLYGATIGAGVRF